MKSFLFGTELLYVLYTVYYIYNYISPMVWCTHNIRIQYINVYTGMAGKYFVVCSMYVRILINIYQIERDESKYMHILPPFICVYPRRKFRIIYIMKYGLVTVHAFCYCLCIYYIYTYYMYIHRCYCALKFCSRQKRHLFEKIFGLFI